MESLPELAKRKAKTEGEEAAAEAAAAEEAFLVNPPCRWYSISSYCRDGTGSVAAKYGALSARPQYNCGASSARPPFRTTLTK